MLSNDVAIVHSCWLQASVSCVEVPLKAFGLRVTGPLRERKPSFVFTCMHALQDPPTPEQPSKTEAATAATSLVRGILHGAAEPSNDNIGVADDENTPRMANHGVTFMSGAGGLWSGSAQLPAFPRPLQLMELDAAPPSVKDGLAALARRKKRTLLARNPALKALQVSYHCIALLLKDLDFFYTCILAAV